MAAEIMKKESNPQLYTKSTMPTNTPTKPNGTTVDPYDMGHMTAAERDSALETKSLDDKLIQTLSENLTGIWEDWNKVNHHDKTNGLSQKAVNAYRREHPGSKLQTAVTTKPSKLKKGSKAAKRRKSFCARMSGNKGPMKKPNGKPTPKALALRRWNCESVEQMQQMILEGEKMIAEIKKGQKDSNGFTKCWPGKHAEGTKKGKNGPVRNCVKNEDTQLDEKWTQKYKNSINCSNPKGFSQKAHCAGKKKK